MTLHQVSLFATTTFGLEAIVRREIEQLGYTVEQTRNGRVDFIAPLSGIARCNLWLRSAERLFLKVGEFEALDFGELFDQTNALPWEQWITPEGNFPVRGRSVDSTLASVRASQKIVKKAIVERLKQHRGGEWIEETGPDFAVEFSFLKDQVTLAIDTSGAGLHKRGYRVWTGPAPLKETLAAALVQLSFWKPGKRLIDPFCGSGTIAIEAALIGRNIAPGLNRSFASEAWAYVPTDLWEQARSEAQAAQRPPLDPKVLAFDTDWNLLTHAREHAQLAGVEEDIHFQCQSFEEMANQKPYGCVIANPPYGIRLGADDQEIHDLYRDMPDIFAQLPTWSFFILTAYPDFEQVLGQQATRRRKLYNGRIECTFYQFHGPKPAPRNTPGNTPGSHPRSLPTSPSENSPDSTSKNAGTGVSETSGGISGGIPGGASGGEGLTSLKLPGGISGRIVPGEKPAFGGLPARTQSQAELFQNRLRKRARHLRRWPTRRGIDCYRLYDRDIPEVPLVVDRYADHLHLAEYDRPHEHSAAEHTAWLEYMKAAAAEVMEVPLGQVFLKQRRRQRGLSQYQRVSKDSYHLNVQEDGLVFELNLSDYVDTGLFLDHRETRKMVRQEASGKRVLNLFAYTGSFSVYAAAGGAKTTTTVDLSHVYLDWATRNMEANGFHVGPKHRMIRSDAVSFLKQLDQNQTFDLAIVDPPTWSNSKTTDNDWDIQKDHEPFLDKLADHLSPDGVVYFSTNSRRFKLDDQVENRYTLEALTHKTIPEDFRNKRIHQCWRLVRKS